MMSKSLVKYTVLFILLALSATLPVITLACTPQTGIEPYHPFRASSSYAENSGYSTGYMPGGNAEFTIGLKNPTEQTIQGEFCLLLLNKEGILTKLIDRCPYILNKRFPFSLPENVTFPGYLQEGPYALVFLVTGYSSLVIDIWIGSSPPRSGEPCPEISSCPE